MEDRKTRDRGTDRTRMRPLPMPSLAPTHLKLQTVLHSPDKQPSTKLTQDSAGKREQAGTNSPPKAASTASLATPTTSQAEIRLLPRATTLVLLILPRAEDREGRRLRLGFTASLEMPSINRETLMRLRLIRILREEDKTRLNKAGINTDIQLLLSKEETRMHLPHNKEGTHMHLPHNKAETHMHLPHNKAETHMHLPHNKEETHMHHLPSKEEIRMHLRHNKVEIRMHLPHNKAEIHMHLPHNKVETHMHPLRSKEPETRMHLHPNREEETRMRLRPNQAETRTHSRLKTETQEHRGTLPLVLLTSPTPLQALPTRNIAPRAASSTQVPPTRSTRPLPTSPTPLPKALLPDRSLQLLLFPTAFQSLAFSMKSTPNSALPASTLSSPTSTAVYCEKPSTLSWSSHNLTRNAWESLEI